MSKGTVRFFMRGSGGKCVRVGVVGSGDRSPDLIRHFDTRPWSSVRWICNQSEDRLSSVLEAHRDAKATKDFGVLLVDRELDAIVIAAPVRHRYEMGKASLLAGKHTFIESPLARTSAECEELMELARRQRLILMVGQPFLYSPAVRKISELVQADAVGEVQYIFARRLNLGIFQTDINVAWDLAPHDVSIIVHLLALLPVGVNCLGNAHVTEGVEDITNMTLTFSDGRSATIQNSWLHPRKVSEMTIVGTRRMIVYDDVKPLEKVTVYDSRVQPPLGRDVAGGLDYTYHYGDRHIPRIAHGEPVKAECLHFLDCVASGKQPLSNGEHGYQLVRILEASSLSLKYEGASVRLDGQLSRKPSPGDPVRYGVSAALGPVVESKLAVAS